MEAWGLEVHASFVGLGLPRLPGRDAQTVWLDERHVLVAGALRHATIDPLTAAAALALLVARGWPKPVDLDDFVEAIDAVRAA